jgi:uncharacterized protein (TIGR02145 family)
MKLKFTFSLAIFILSKISAQTNMNIYQNNGSVLQIPLNTIDSITYFSNNVDSGIFHTGAGVTFDGYVYSSIVLNNGQEWISENLRTTIYSNGDPIPNVPDTIQWGGLTTGAWIYYNNNNQFENPYGKLYNWYAVSDSRNVCPIGWHVPSDSEWIELMNFLDPNTITSPNSIYNVVGGKMKSTDSQYWLSPNTGANNKSGFTATGAGRLISSEPTISSFSSLKQLVSYWSSTEFSIDGANCFSLSFLDDSGNRNIGHFKRYGFSIRCIKN